MVILYGCAKGEIIIPEKENTLDMTSILSFMTEGWSLGNECNSNLGLFIVNGSVNLNGRTLEILEGELTITGDLIYNGGIVDSLCINSSVLVKGNIIW